MGVSVMIERLYTESMSDWDAERYHRLSAPQQAWGRAVLARVDPAPGARVLDLGCGTGRLTAELARAPGILVTGLDRSASMLAEAAAASLPHVMLVRGDGAALPFLPSSFDLVFSTATFHWIADHDRLFAEVHAILKPHGRLVAQCGGGPNLARLIGRAHALMESTAFAERFRGWSDPWQFATVDDTRARLARAGFESIEVSLEPAPTQMADADAFRDFISCVCVRHHVDRLPPGERPAFVAALTDLAAGDSPPFTLDYWRLNLSATKGRS
jgi:trans-aconitate 2-methyltransferase